MNRLALGAWATVCALLVPAAGLADVPPPDACNMGTIGAACANAKGPSGSYNATGTCQNATCMKYGPLADGGLGTYSYACALCEASDGGSSSDDASSGSSSSSGAASSSGADGSTESKGSGSKGGCMVGAMGAQAAGPLLLVAAGAVLVAASRRRRDRR